MTRRFAITSKVLITGHTGFKGSWLAIWLKELGADVVGYSLDPPSEPNNFEATKLREKITHIHGDIRDLDRLMETFKKNSTLYPTQWTCINSVYHKSVNMKKPHP